MNKNKGFTIIELIVVIAIIAILAAIVLISISGYIKKGQDASLKETMHTVQTDVISDATTGAGLKFASADPCSYVVATATTPVHGTKAWTDGILKLQAGTDLAKCASNFVNTASANDKFCACVEQLSNTGRFICVDTSKQVETSTNCLTNCVTGGDFTCPAAN